MVRYTSNGTPSEDDEEAALADYCDLRGWRHTHFSNETYTPSYNQKRKMKKLGVHSGCPDHLVIVPQGGGVFPTTTAFVEMKRQKGGTISDDQFRWIRDLLDAGQYATVCEGAEDAIKYLEAIEKDKQSVINEYDDKFEEKYEKWLKKQKNRDVF